MQIATATITQSTRNPNEQLIGHVLVNLKHILVLKVFKMHFCHSFVQLFSNEAANAARLNIMKLYRKKVFCKCFTF